MTILSKRGFGLVGMRIDVSSKDLSTQIHLTVVYGLHSIHDRLPLWEGLRSISIQHSPWLCVGDYNSVLHTSDRLHGTDVIDYETRDFQSLLMIWTSLRSKAKGPSTLGLIRLILALELSLELTEFLAWGSGNSVWKKLNFVKSSFKSLNSKQFGNIEGKIDQANVELSRIQNLMAQNPDDLDLYTKESDAIKVVKHWNDFQESIFKQKSRINWVKLGDGNSHYFFSVMKTRQARNRIDSIFDSNQVFLKDPDVISHEIISFYKSLLGTQAPWLPAVDLLTMRRGKQLSFATQSYLIRPIEFVLLSFE
ncbi:uncharacterized protein LOC110732115 [Chenopodium quinoa]|uniref:uncharacterized protein LOC110732115 n=1 Tax=Chenopodium quinoa TaxID=63459 RepID=UPI000B774B0B|nr:uncharacterized protein LOC110732115 [Chenopodium quinoa]